MIRWTCPACRGRGAVAFVQAAIDEFPSPVACETCGLLGELTTEDVAMILGVSRNEVYRCRYGELGSARAAALLDRIIEKFPAAVAQ